MKTKYTKGKWFRNYSNLNLRDKLQITCENENGSCHICDCDVSAILTKDEKRANANLIAAAPDLLEALVELKKDIEADRYNYRLGTMNKVDMAIKKATE